MLLLSTLAALFFTVYLFGVWLGMRGTLKIYRNYYDVVLTGCLYIIPIFFLPFIVIFGGSESPIGAMLIAAVFIIEATLLFIIIIRTALDNRNPAYFILSLYIKIPTAIFFSASLYDAFTGKQGGSRRESAFWSLFMVPIIHGLVHDKKTGALPSLREVLK